MLRTDRCFSLVLFFLFDVRFYAGVIHTDFEKGFICAEVRDGQGV